MNDTTNKLIKIGVYEFRKHTEIESPSLQLSFLPKKSISFTYAMNGYFFWLIEMY